MFRFAGACSLLALVVLTGIACQPASAQDDNKPAELVNRLVKDLGSGDASVRLAAAALLGDIADGTRGQRGRDRLDVPPELLRDSAGPELAKLAADPEPAVRRMAVLALGKVHAAGDLAVPAWSRALQDSDAAVRQAVPEALRSWFKRGVEIGRSISTPGDLLPAEQFFQDITIVAPTVRAALASSDKTVVLKTLQALEGLLDSMERTPDLKGTGVDPLIITEAVTEPLRSLLPKVAEALRSFLPEILNVVRQPPTENQRQAALVIEKLARPIDPRTDPLERREGGPRIRGRFLQRDLGAEGAAALKILKEGLDEIVPALIPLVSQPPICVQLALLDTLEVLGPEAKPAVPAIRIELRNPDRFVRWAAARALSRIGPVDDNLPTILGLAELVKDDDLDVATSAADYLGDDWAKYAVAAVPALSCAAMSEERELQYAAVIALSHIVATIKGEARAAVPGLVVALGSSDLKTRQAVPPILGELGPEAQAALPALQKALDDEDLDVRLQSAKAMLKIRGQ
jgi:HEAT repeat protein